MSAEEVVTLWTFQVANSLGVWESHWFGTREEAKGKRQYLIDIGRAVLRPEQTGELGDVTQVFKVEVQLSKVGVLAFARNWAEGG
jgi:hypothetical protein